MFIWVLNPPLESNSKIKCKSNEVNDVFELSVGPYINDMHVDRRRERGGSGQMDSDGGFGGGQCHYDITII